MNQYICWYITGAYYWMRKYCRMCVYHKIKQNSVGRGQYLCLQSICPTQKLIYFGVYSFVVYSDTRLPLFCRKKNIFKTIDVVIIQLHNVDRNNQGLSCNYSYHWLKDFICFKTNNHLPSRLLRDRCKQNCRSIHAVLGQYIVHAEVLPNRLMTTCLRDA